jgi:hypothetical protein
MTERHRAESDVVPTPGATEIGLAMHRVVLSLPGRTAVWLHEGLVGDPVIMAVDDEAAVLHAVQRDLSSHYSGSVAVMFVHRYLSEA